MAVVEFLVAVRDVRSLDELSLKSVVEVVSVNLNSVSLVVLLLVSLKGSFGLNRVAPRELFLIPSERL